MIVQRYALVDANDDIVHVTNWDGDTEKWQPSEGIAAHVVAEGLFVSRGWKWNNGNPIDPNPPAETPAPDNSAAEVQASRARQLDDAISKFGKGTEADRLTTIEGVIERLIKG